MVRQYPETVGLTVDEENQLVEYLIEMYNRGLGLLPTQLKMKVYEMTKERWTSFKNGIPGGGWMRWWKHCHPELSLRTSHALEATRASGLCEENVASFHDNLEILTSTHDYPPRCIWNCDESGAQAGKIYSLSEAIVRAWSGERGAGILRAGSRNYCPSLINIKIPLEIEI
jgi:hypothetical protein